MRALKVLNCAGGWVSLLVAGVLIAGTTTAGQGASPRTDAIPFATLVEQNCTACHNDKLRTAGLSLQGRDFSQISADAPVWEKVLRKVRSGEMPPSTARTRPTPEAAASFAAFLETTLDRASAAAPNPGTAPVHRLNRAEYSNAIRDLLAVDVRPGNWLPVDDSGYGFDNIAAVLSTSPLLLERYMAAARRISRLAVGDRSLKPIEDTYDAVRDPLKGVRNERTSDDLPFDSRAGISVRHYFPADAEYVFKIRFANLLQTADDQVVNAYQVRVPVQAGLHTVGVTSPRDNTKVENEGPAGRGGGASRALNQVPYPVDLRLDGARVKRFDVPAAVPDVTKLIIGGPFDISGLGNTVSRQQIFICHPVSASQEPACARRIVATLARRAFRRPVTAADVEPLYAFFEKGRAGGGTFESGVQRAIEALLVAPEFLFRVERDPAQAQPGKPYPLSNLELASRLSFFLWSSIPDEELLRVAERGKLTTPGVLELQVARMLADPKSDALIQNFAGQWLQFRNVETAKPDATIFPFDEALRQAFIKESELFVASIAREDRSLLDMLTADYTFVNERLAAHYGIPNVYGSQFRRVTITDANRRGLLGKGSILTVTSYPNRTSVVQRGKWILENFLGTPPPPPPPDVPELKAERDGKTLSLRDQMQAHRANAICAACHARMDPIGFALENYDGVGKWRTEDAGTAIDASGKLPDGTVFNGPDGLTQLMLGKYRDDFVRTATEKLLTYALGRGVEYYDNPAVREIVRQASHDNYRWSALVTAIVKSTPFQMRRASQS
jgi:mono/diheme cytochrome c family protein